MKTNMLTSGFNKGFPSEFAQQLQRILTKREFFVFLASEFEHIHQKTDRYFNLFLDMFMDCGIQFNRACVVDSRMSIEKAHQVVASADVLWLAGGDTINQIHNIKEYGLIPVIQSRSGITIGMSAGSINMAKTAVCTVTCGHEEQSIYEGLGLVDLSVEPHFNSRNISDELLQISQDYPLYGMCDDSVIICEDGKTTYIGDIYYISRGNVKLI
ncbi:MAG TPA: hypothetical protein DDZ89_17250 [Clostridiales bacterium]|nr:hypothetical protein [Clostridiales bacterium]